MQPEPRVLVAVLAAGASRRMGAPKLLLPWPACARQGCLLTRACGEALASAAAEVAVVTGAYAHQMAPLLRELESPGLADPAAKKRLHALPNPAWREGQASSVRTAAAYARKQGFDALVLLAADQPHVAARHLDALVGAFRDAGAPALPHAWRAAAQGRAGNPCLFSAGAFGLLCELEGDQGARQFFASGAVGCTPVVFSSSEDQGLFDDVDTPDDYVRLLAAPLEEKTSEPMATRTVDADPAPDLPPLAPRADFPLLGRTVGRHGETVCYLDGAATAPVPGPVRRAVDDYLTTSCANIHRGAHLLAEESTDRYERAREHAARFIGARDPERLVLTHGTTESLNLAARCWGAANLRPGDTVVLTEEAHHAAIVPFQMLAAERGVHLAWVRLGADGLLDPASWKNALSLGPRLVVLTAMSNVLGYRQPLFGTMAHQAREAGALVAVDAAQALGHGPLWVEENPGEPREDQVGSGLRVSEAPVTCDDAIPCDFLAFSAHKFHGLTGIGGLWCSERAFDAMVPAFGGGGMIERVTLEDFWAAPGAAAFEPGTPAIAAAVAMDAALSYLEALGLEQVRRHGEELCARAVRGLGDLPGVHILGGPDRTRDSLVSFVLDGVHPHDAGERLSARGVMVRAGHHCAMPLHTALGVRASLRASFGVHCGGADVDRLVEAVREIAGGAAAR